MAVTEAVAAAKTVNLAEESSKDDVRINVFDQSTIPTISQTLPVPRNLVGYLVGKRGRTLQGIQQGSQTKIFIQENSKDEDWCYVHIQGSSRHINRAKKILINAIIRACENKPRGARAKQVGKNEVKKNEEKSEENSEKKSEKETGEKTEETNVKT